MKKEKEEIASFMNTKKEELVTCAYNLEFSKSLNEIKKHVSTLKHEHLIMKEMKDLQQYVRRPNLRIYGVKVGNNETNDNIEATVKQTNKDMHINITEHSVD